VTHDVVATLLWTMLAVALLLTGIAFARRSFWLMLVAAHLTLLFGLAAIFSVGIFVILIAVLQFIAAFSYLRADRRRAG
jgi:hypothetical protein